VSKLRYARQFGIIITISLMGELLRKLLPFSMPGSIYGLIIILIALCTGVLKVEEVKGASDFLLEIMPILFIPSTVGLMESWGILKEILIPVLIVCIFGTVIVMGVTGQITQLVINKTNRKSKINGEYKNNMLKDSVNGQKSVQDREDERFEQYR